ERAGDDHSHECPAAARDVVAKDHDLVAREGAGGERARVDHDKLACGREDRVEHHQQEDSREPVVADRRSDRPGDRRQRHGWEGYVLLEPAAWYRRSSASESARSPPAGALVRRLPSVANAATGPGASAYAVTAPSRASARPMS